MFGDRTHPSRIVLTSKNKAMNLVASPSSSGADFERMYIYASEHGVYLEHRYRDYITASTQWKIMVLQLQKPKNQKLHFKSKNF